MARRRQKKRTHVGAHHGPSSHLSANHSESRTPKTMVIRVGAGEVGSSVSHLVKDVRKTMEPWTARRLKERKSNRLRDYTTMAGPLGVSHLLLFSKSSTGNTNLRLALVPRGPTLHFRVEKYSLCKDVQKSLRHPTGGEKEFLNPPLLVMNNFVSPRTDDASTRAVPKHLESLSTTIFQSLFPPISPQSTPLSSIRRVLLLNRELSKSTDASLNEETRYVINMRHYGISTKATGVSKGVRRISTAGRTSKERRSRLVMPNLGNLEDVADYIANPSVAGPGFTSGSESEMETDAEVEIFDAGRERISNTKHVGGAPYAKIEGQRNGAGTHKRAVRLVELGPRMRLRLTKVEEGVCGGKVMWHEYLSKSESEIRELEEVWEIRKSEKAERKRVQKENVERKRNSKDHNKENANGADRDPIDNSHLSSDDESWDSEGSEIEETRRSLSFEPHTLDPNEYALAAAAHAFERAAGPDLSSKAAEEVTLHPTLFEIERPLNRSRSVRFAGPTALPARGPPITIRAAPVNQFDQELQLRSVHQGSRRNKSPFQDDDDFMTALPSHGEYVETQVASQPSSYRKLRKSKSLFNPGHLSTTFSSAVLRPPAFRTQDDARLAGRRSGQARAYADSRLGRSFSFRRPHSEQVPSEVVISNATQHGAVQLARDQFLRHLERQRIGERPSTGNPAIHRRPPKAFRKTCRTSSTNSYGSAVESPESLLKERFERRRAGSKARALSLSFKNRIKRVFNRSSEEEVTLPAQHLQATRPHFGGSTGPLALPEKTGQVAETLSYGIPDGKRSRQGSLAGSIHSADSHIDMDDRRSRVTSWTNSTAVNTITAHQASGPKRLSVIQETGVVSSQPGSLRQPENLKPNISSYHVQQRKSSLYAKLQLRMSKSHSVSHLCPPSIDAGDNNLDARFNNSRISASSQADTFEVPSYCASDQDRTYTSTTLVLAPKVDGQCPAPQDTGATPADLAIHEASESSPKRPLRESKSTFFPQSTRIERSNTSPFRKAMQSNSQCEQRCVATAMRNRHEGHERISSLALPNVRRDQSVARSESLYSRTSSGDTPERDKSFKSSIEMNKDRVDQITDVSPIAAFENREELVRPTSDKAQEAESMKDPQDRPSKPRVQTNTVDLPRKQPGKANVRENTSHQREHAQLNGEETDLGRLYPSTELSKGFPSAPVGLNARCSLRHAPSQTMIDRFPLMSIDTQRSAKTHEQNSPGSLSKATHDASEARNYRSTNRLDKGRENMNPKHRSPSLSPSSTNVKAHNGWHNESWSNCNGQYDRSQDGYLWHVSTPVSHSRSSPERIARLRRMYSSNSLGLSGVRSHVKPSPKFRKSMHETDQNIQRGEEDHPEDRHGHLVGSRQMVDVFLSDRRQSHGGAIDDSVFI
ncbi:MAG: hypothetical protein Q9170_006736 [Blastenia crenularia]